MSSTPLNSNGRGSLLRRCWWMLVLVLVVVVGLVIAIANPSRIVSAARSPSSPLYPVKSGPLTISVTSSGSIRNSDAVVLKNEVEGVTTILYLVEEGVLAKKGDLLVELDSSQMQDNKVDQEIKVEIDYASLVKAKETLEITRTQGEADIKTAEVDLELAMLDLEKYTGLSYSQVLGEEATAGEKPDLQAIAQRLSGVDWTTIDLSHAREGEYRQQLQEAENKITLSKAELKRATDKHNGSQKLHEKGYITKTELEADELDLQRRKLEVEVAESDMNLLERYTKRSSLAQRMNDVDQKTFALKKARHAASSNVVDAGAQLASREMSHKREKEKLQKLADQITKCKIYAPSDGMVVYATSSDGGYGRYEPLDEGIQVRERQELIRIPTAGSMVADIKVHESVVEKIREGLPAIVTTDAMAGREFHGRVRKVAVVPDSQNSWLNPGLKVYNTEVLIETDAADLKPGMSCTTEIVVDRYENTAYVPVQAVLRVAGEPTVYVMDNDGQPQPRTVVVGLDNNRMIRIIQGLADGEMVMLNPPVEPSAKPQERQSLAGVQIPPAPKPSEARPAPAQQQPPQAAQAQADVNDQEKPAAQAAGGLDINSLRSRFEKMTAEERQKFMESEEGRKLMEQVRAQAGNRGAGPGGASRGERTIEK